MTTPEASAPQAVSIAWGRSFRAPTVQLESGQIITDASRVTVDCETGAAPKIFLEFTGDHVADLQVDGVVHVVREIPADLPKAVCEFLGAIDPAELDRSVLSVMEMGGPETYGQATIEVMKRWARGD